MIQQCTRGPFHQPPAANGVKLSRRPQVYENERKESFLHGWNLCYLDLSPFCRKWVRG